MSVAKELRLHSDLLEAAHEAIFAWTPERGITFWNHGAEQQYGWSAAEAVGRSSHDLLQTPPEQVEAFLAALDRAGQWEGELCHTTRDGRQLAVEARVALASVEGGQQVVEATRDVTEQRRAAARSAFLVEAGRVLGSSLDYEQTLSSVARLAIPHIADWCAVDLLDSASALRRIVVTHSDPAKVQLAHTLQERYSPDPGAAAGPARVARTGESELVGEVPDEVLQRTGGGAERLEVLRALGIRSYMIVPMQVRGVTLGTISFVAAESGRRFGPDDLTVAEELARRAAVAIENARLYQAARDEARLREQLLAVVAHDLRGPLTAIIGTADVLERDAVAGEIESNRVAAQSARISRAAKSMAVQIAELLDTARLHAGQPLALNRRPTDLVALANAAVAQAQVTTARHTISVEASVPELVGNWDGDRLERVVANLLSNAIKYSPEGGEVIVRIGRDEQSGQRFACLSVADRGIGIPAGEVSRVFERYHRATNALERFPGEGIGLSGARQIVEQHGGTIDVQSEEGRGSVFSVRLPM